MKFIQSAFKLPRISYSTNSESSIEDKLKADHKGAAMNLYFKILQKVDETTTEWPIRRDDYISELLATLYRNYTSFFTESRFRFDNCNMFVDGENIGSIDNLNVNALLVKSVISPPGLGTETFVDKNIRKAREITADRITFAPKYGKMFEELVYNDDESIGIMNYFQDHVKWNSIMYDFQNSKIKLNKLCIFETGGFFKSHVNPLLADNHVGSVDVVLPIPHKGGELVIRKGKQEAVCSPKEEDNSCDLFSFFTDCEHEVRPVTSGCRLSLQFDVYCDKSRPYVIVGEECDEDEEDRYFFKFPQQREQHYKESLSFHNKFDPDSLKEELVDAVKNSLRHGPLALMLYYKYQSMDMNPSMLKGVDYEIWNLLQDTFEMDCQSIIINSSWNSFKRKEVFFWKVQRD